MVLSSGARAQSIGGQLSDPKKCVVILDGMGDVGFRISDSQAIADAIVTGLRERVGFDGAAYAGIAESARAMKKLLATPEGAGPQEAQLAWYRSCEDNAPWRVRARFGTDKKGKQHWITIACRKRVAGGDGPTVEEKRLTGRSFLDAREQLIAAVPSFCGQIPSVSGLFIEPMPGASQPGEPPGMAKKKEPKPWTPPPRRD